MRLFEVLLNLLCLSSVLTKSLNFKKSLKQEIVFKRSFDDTCEKQFLHYEIKLDERSFWARQMRDSWGNLPSGIFSGNLYDFGSFDQCINFKHETKEVGKILGQHCTLLIPFDFEDDSNARFMPPTRKPQINIGVGVCVPASCNPKQVKKIADELLTKEFNVTTSPFYDQSAFCSVTRAPLEFNNLQLFST